VIYTIAPSTLSAAVLWIGTDDGLVWRSDDAGAHWREVTPQALTPWSKVACIELSHFDPAVAYLAIDRHRLDDDEPYLYRTQDGGKEWVRIDAGIPRASFVNVVREDPAVKGLLYAGTERGMFMSLDAGAHWQPLQQNLPVTSVRDIDVHGDDLVIATHGRGFWIMDDVSALRQMRTLHSDQAVLFKPATAIRVRPSNFTGTPMPKDEPLAANPPDGAMIDYAMPAAVEGPVTLTIRDTHANLVRRFGSADIKQSPDSSKLEFAPEWVPTPAVLSTTPGMHRFIWDLRYPSAEPATAKQPSPQGAWAPPGRYEIELNVAGRNFHQPLEVKEDPRVTISQAALLREFTLTQQIEHASARASNALQQATRLLDALDSRLAQSTAPHEDIVRLRAKAWSVSGVPPHSASRNTPPLRTDSLRTLAADLHNLEGAADGADADPGPDVRASFATLSRMLTAALSDWGSLLNHDLVELNARLKAAGEPLIAT
jgi:hypothetical protein